MKKFAGLVASSGTAVGTLHRTDRPQSTTLPVSLDGDPEQLITAAFDTVAERLLADSSRLRNDHRTEQADILEVIGSLATDPDLRKQAIERASDGLPFAMAVQRAVDTQADLLAALPDPTLAERATDVRQVGKRVIAQLYGHQPVHSDTPLVLVAAEIGAADLLEPTVTVAAAASTFGGPNSHAAIVARSLGIPLMVGTDPALLEHPDGLPVVVDGVRGAVVVTPPEAELARAEGAMRAERARRAALAAERHLPTRTVDGYPVVLRANVATPIETRAAVESRAEGIGLLRTELPFLDADAWPTEAQHRAVLGPILRAVGPRPVTVRTLDFADDKLPPFLSGGASAGRIGRGLPLMLAEPDAFGRQFRAIIDLAGQTDAQLRVMIPMVASVAEFDACRALLDREATALGQVPPPLGVMVELPEALAVIEELAERADFLSIGSNDLTGQLLGLDRRDHSFIPALGAHPVVLRAVEATVAAGHRYGRQVSVCGDAAADPLVLPLLLGLGCDALSVAPARLDEVAGTARRLEHAACVRAATDALRADDVDQAWLAVRRECCPTLP